MAVTVIHNATVFTGVTMVTKSAVIINEGKIEDVCADTRLPQKDIPADAIWIDAYTNMVVPGFIDTHIHGIGGFGTEDHTTESILHMSRLLLETGVTSFCPTIYPQAEEDFLTSIRACANAIGKEPGAKILGIHLEGPFISPEKPGVQLTKHFKNVDIEAMKRYIAASNNTILNMTVAPELKNMRDLALFCTKQGIVLQAGHTNATYNNMVEGIEAGILHSTHFFNAMRPLNHRDPGVVGAIMIHPEISCEIIADGFHVHPAIVQLLLKEKSASKIALITDALKTTRQTEGELIANGEQVYLDENIFRRTSDGVIAGSSLTMDRGVRNLVSWGIPLTDALSMASVNPAAIMGKGKIKGSLLPGQDADIVICSSDLSVLATFVQGQQVYSTFSENHS
ncbi:MAG: N-acetylglucosamine-6-phosphate deacetylase [Spirochaeta sp.]